MDNREGLFEEDVRVSDDVDAWLWWLGVELEAPVICEPEVLVDAEQTCGGTGGGGGGGGGGGSCSCNWLLLAVVVVIVVAADEGGDMDRFRYCCCC